MSLKIIGVLLLLLVIAVSIAVLSIKKNRKLTKKVKDQQEAIDEAEKAIVRAREYMKVHAFVGKEKETTKEDIENAKTVDDIHNSFDAGLDRLRKLRGE